MIRSFHIVVMNVTVLSLFVCCCIVPRAFGATDDLVTLYVPAFEGPGSLGQNVSTILNLEIWRTLRKAPTPNPKKQTFGRGLVVWDTQTLPEQSFQAAEEIVRQGITVSFGRIYPQLVLWGKARQFGDGVVVESFLTISPPYAPSTRVRDRWEITVPFEHSTMTIDADLPRRRYEFSAIVLEDEIVQMYTTPKALKIFDFQTGKRPIGMVGNKFEAREHRGNSVLLESDGMTGWVHLPKLLPSEVVNFAGGVIRILRGDWEGAIGLFQQVVQNPHAPSSLKVDALLYQVLSKSKAGHDPHDIIKEVYEQAPYSRIAVMYSVMAKLEQVRRFSVKQLSDSPARALIDEIRQELASNNTLFSEDDPWLVAIMEFLNSRP